MLKMIKGQNSVNNLGEVKFQCYTVDIISILKNIKWHNIVQNVGKVTVLHL